MGPMQLSLACVLHNLLQCSVRLCLVYTFEHVIACVQNNFLGAAKQVEGEQQLVVCTQDREKNRRYRLSDIVLYVITYFFEPRRAKAALAHTHTHHMFICVTYILYVLSKMLSIIQCPRRPGAAPATRKHLLHDRRIRTHTHTHTIMPLMRALPPTRKKNKH